MLRSWRWAVVIAGVAVLAALPATIAALPAGHSDISAATLLQRVQRSGSLAYSGYAESSGGLALPVTNQFSSVADLFGGPTQMRVWSRGARDWRVDTIDVTGESDVHQNGANVWTWDYESSVAVLTVEAAPRPARLPTSGDLLPTTLGQRLLSQATADEVTRLPVQRIAGRDAVGLRLHPREQGSTIDQVDVWADPSSGLPLRVEVRGAGVTVVSTRFLEFSTATPSAASTRFTPPADARVRANDDPDLVALIDRLGQVQPPGKLAGIARNPQLPPLGSIGVYGHGVTEFAATPLFGRTARSLRRELADTPGVTTSAAGQAISVGPLSLVLTPDDGWTWLLSGTVDLRTLTAAAVELAASGR